MSSSTKVVAPPPHPPQPVNPEALDAMTKLFTSFATTPVLSGAKFGAPKSSGDNRNVKLVHSQRDVNTNGFKSLHSHRILNPFTNSFISITPAYESTTVAIQSPSGLLTLSLRINTTPGANGAAATKQTLLEIFVTETQELLSSQYLDGYILTSTPFSPPQWSPDERHICFSLVSNQTIAVLEKILTARHALELTTTTAAASSSSSTNTNPNDKSSQQQQQDQPQLKLNVEQALTKSFTDDRYQTHMDLGEQLNGIQYPYLLIYSINNHTNPITTVHHPSFYTSFMPTSFHFAPTLADKDQPAVIEVDGIDTTTTTTGSEPTFAPYPIIFAAQPIFQHRLGTIFYSTRPSRLYASVVYLTTALITPSTTIITPSQVPVVRTPIQYEQPPIPITWCLTPDAHCTHELGVFTPEQTDSGSAQQQQQQPQPQLYKPQLKVVNQYVDVTYLEGHAYDTRWGLSQELHNIIKSNQDDKVTMEKKVEKQDDDETSQDTVSNYLSQHMFEFSNTYAELLTPHGTTLAVRVLRIPAAEYTKMVCLLAQMTQYANLYHFYFAGLAAKKTKSENEGCGAVNTGSTMTQIANTVAAITASPQFRLIAQFDQLYKASLPQWPLQTGLLSTNYILNHINPQTSLTTDMPMVISAQESMTQSKHDLASQLVQLVQSWSALVPQSLLPVNPYSYGAHISTIHRITPELIVFSNSLRDAQTIQFIHYTPHHSKGSTFAVSTAILVPPQTTLQSFATTQLNQTTTPVNTPQGRHNSAALTPLIPDGAELTPVLTVPSPTNPKRVSKLPLLPISTQFSTLPADREQIFTPDNNSYLYHHTVPSLQLHDFCFNPTNQQISLLVGSSNVSSPPTITLVNLPLATFEDVPSELVYRSIPQVFCPTLRFHTTPETATGALNKAKPSGQVYTPFLFHAPSSTAVQSTQFSPLLIQSMQNLHSVTVDMRPYNSFGQSQLIVTYDRHLYPLLGEGLISPPRGDQCDVQQEQQQQQGKVSPLSSSSPRGLILLPHGGPHSSFQSFFDLTTAYLATLGFLVLRINYSGSPSYGEVALRSLMGYIGYMDTTECLFAVDTVCHLFGLAPNNPAVVVPSPTQKACPIYYFGGSHSGYLGGFVSVYRHFTSLVIRNAVLSLHTTGATSDIYDWVFSCLGMVPQSAHFFFSDECADNADGASSNRTPTPQQQSNLQDKMNFHSPMTYLHHIKTPTLLEIGGGDKRVPCLQSYAYSKILNQNGYHSMVNFYPTAQHSLADSPHINSHSLCSAVAFFYRFAPSSLLPPGDDGRRMIRPTAHM